MDLVVGACRDAGFEPLPGPPRGSLQDTLALIGAGVPGWTVVYASYAQQLANPRIAFREADLSLPGVLAVPARLPGSGCACCWTRAAIGKRDRCRLRTGLVRGTAER
ncbi:hypothetical protein ACFQZC_22485 [Streptacidiphilus monticola]